MISPREHYDMVESSRSPPPGWGRPQSASGGPCSLNRALVGKIYKTKIAEYSQFSGGRSGQIWSGTLPRGPAGATSSRGGSAAVVPGPIGLTVDRELCYHPGSIYDMVESSRSPPPGWGRPRSASGGPCSHTCAFLGIKFIKPKLQNTPGLEGSGWVRTSLGPHPGVRQLL